MTSSFLHCNMTEPNHSAVWERALWKKQSYPDNYVDDSFFRVHTKGHKVLYCQAFYGSVLITQEVCSCVCLVAVFFGIFENQLKAPAVLLGITLLTITCYSMVHLWDRAKSCSGSSLEMFLEELKITLFTVVLSWFSSPIIKTLTASVATDTIHACTTALLLLHLAFHPYGADVSIVNSTVSHNLGLFASICLASRLESNMDVFVLLIVAIVMFNLLPTFRNICVKNHGAWSMVTLTLVMLISSLLGSYFFAPSLGAVFIVATLFLNGFAPILFIYLQSYRKNIYGPWDEALIEDKT